MDLEAKLLDWVEARKGGTELPLRIRTWSGRSVDLARHPRVTIELTNPAVVRHLLRPDLGTLGKAYIEGQIQLEGPILEAIQVASALCGPPVPKPGLPWRFARRHTRRADEAAIRYHYDVSNDFYALWLDRQMVYSCAYFETGREDLHQAQEQKLDHICRKLMLKPGERLLDIGCGWGGLIRWAAEHYGVDATGITLSRNQYEYARERIAAEGLEDRCRVVLEDYRDHGTPGRYDKIASVGMFEHVGLRNLPVYFGTARRLLREGGLMLNHGITLPQGARPKGLDPGDFIEKYVFPHGELPTMPHALHAMSEQDLEVLDVECLRPHYAQTLLHWVDRLEGQRARAAALVGEQRYRIWQVYMAGCAKNFEQGGVTIYQVLASKQPADGPAAWPWSRAHLYRPDAAREPARPAQPTYRES